MAELIIPVRFRGPARSGNGGYTSGSLAEQVPTSTESPTIEVTLRRPPPLGLPMSVTTTDDVTVLADGDAPGDRLDAWREGRTGFPIVDAGMRQLRETGWMHNRVRMIVASFLVKDLHVEWQHGARHFMQWLVDGDLASNQHGWQWTTGCGTDAAPYFRVFNPASQGAKFDPDGIYVKRWVPELRDLDPNLVHEPSAAPDGAPDGYPQPIVDHKEERTEALARYDRVKR